MKTSIIIVTWRSKNVLQKCIESLYGGGYLHREIIVVDNNSRDGTAEMLKNDFPDIILIPNDRNLGFSQANNQAIQIARGQYLMFLNPDTEVIPDSISLLEKWLDEYNDYVAVGPKIVNPDGEIWRVCARRLPTLWTEFCNIFKLDTLFPKSKFFAYKYYGAWDRNSDKDVECLVGAAILVKANAIRNIKGFDESVPLFLDDMDLCKNLGRLGKIRYLHKAKILHHHNVSGQQQPNIRILFLGYQAIYTYMAKYNGKIAAFLYVITIFFAALIVLFITPLILIFNYKLGRKLFNKFKSMSYWLLFKRNEKLCRNILEN